jgi:hypothetical protein
VVVGINFLESLFKKWEADNIKTQQQFDLFLKPINDKLSGMRRSLQSLIKKKKILYMWQLNAPLYQNNNMQIAKYNIEALEIFIKNSCKNDMHIQQEMNRLKASLHSLQSGFDRLSIQDSIP